MSLSGDSETRVTLLIMPLIVSQGEDAQEAQISVDSGELRQNSAEEFLSFP